MSRDQQDSILDGVKRNTNAALLLMEVHSSLLAPWLRKPGTWGARFQGVQGLLGLAWVWVFTTLTGYPAQLVPVMWFWLSTLFLLLVHRVAGVFRKHEVHSRYVGDSVFGLAVEPWVCLVGGVCLLPVSIPLALYVMVGGGCLAVELAYMRMRDAARVRAVRDARLEQEWLAGEVRESG